MVLQQRVHLVSEYVGLPKLTNFEFREEEISEELQDGEYMYRSLYISVDPFMRVTKTKNEKFPVGTKMIQMGGWCTIGKANGSSVFYVPKNLDSKMLSAANGVLGMTGFTAYIGLVDICKPKKGETVMISGAAGAVGNVVGQIAKIKGCRVIGSSGSDEKVKFLKSIGYDDAFNYKASKSWQESIKKMAPNGIDCYFDNVGGDMSDAVLRNMNLFGRIALCGCISSYNATEQIKCNIIQPSILQRQLTMTGFNIMNHVQRYDEAFNTMKKWVEEGKLKSIEHVTSGFKNLPQSFIDMLQGKNTGKAIVKIPTSTKL